jgi:hypothetical protein
MDNSEQDQDDLDISELRKKLRETSIERDSWQIQAAVSDASLKKILRSPAWKLTKPFRILNLIAWRIKPELLDDTSATWEIQSSGPTVYEEVKDSISIEIDNADFKATKIAIIAQWSKSEVLSLSTNMLISQLMESGFEVLLVSDCESHKRLVLDDENLGRIYKFPYTRPKITDQTNCSDINSGPAICFAKEIEEVLQKPFIDTQIPLPEIITVSSLNAHRIKGVQISRRDRLFQLV